MGVLTLRCMLAQIFFLFTGCLLAGAFFYEIERGTECYVGKPCMWWGKNVLTPRFAAGLPNGKRVLIQDTRPVIIVDMIHSSWLSYSTYVRRRCWRRWSLSHSLSCGVCITDSLVWATATSCLGQRSARCSVSAW